MAVRKTSKGRSRQKQALEPTETTAAVPTNGQAEKLLNAQNGRSPSFEQIQRRAYELFVARGGNDGCDWADWFRAEQELTAASAVGNGHHM